MALAAASVLEAPLPIEDVRRDDGHDSGDDFGGHRLGLKNCQLQRVENRRVNDKRRRADNGKLDQLVMPFGERPERAGKSLDRGISKGHSARVYGRVVTIG